MINFAKYQDAKQIKDMGRKLRKFSAEFDDCFGRSGPRERLRRYISGRLSHLPRKSVEPVASPAKVIPGRLNTLPPFSGSGAATLVRWTIA